MYPMSKWNEINADKNLRNRMSFGLHRIVGSHKLLKMRSKEL